MPRELTAKGDHVFSLIWEKCSLQLIPYRINYPSVFRILAVHSLVEKRAHDGTALRVCPVHEGVEIRQEGVSGLQDASRDILEGIIPGHRVLPLQQKKRSFRGGLRGAGGPGVTECLLQTKIKHN